MDPLAALVEAFWRIHPIGFSKPSSRAKRHGRMIPIFSESTPVQSPSVFTWLGWKDVLMWQTSKLGVDGLPK